MSIKVENPKILKVWEESYDADGDLTNLENCAVEFSAGASGEAKVKAPSGAGVRSAGILTSKASTSGTRAVVLKQGMAKARASGTFNSGTELSIHGTTGRLKAAGAADYVVAISREASSKVDHLVAVEVIPAYQKNA